MNIGSKDLNLLVLFNALYQELNVTAAAEKLSLSQPALSHKLNKLRRQFDDPLFVRAGRGISPTPKADTLAPRIADLLSQIEQFYYVADDSDFLHKHDIVHIFSTDFIEQYLLPRLLPIVRREAPNLQLVFHNTRGRLPQKELEQGACDIAIAGFYQNLPAALFQQTLGDIGFSVLASKQNALITDTLDVQTYLTCPHLVTTLTGDLDGLVDRALRAQGMTRRVVAGLSSFVAPAASIQNSDYLLTCLHPIAVHAVTHYSDLIHYPCPVEVPGAHIQQFWHQRSHQDPMRQWLRQHIKRLMADGL